MSVDEPRAESYWGGVGYSWFRVEVVSYHVDPTVEGTATTYVLKPAMARMRIAKPSRAELRASRPSIARLFISKPTDAETWTE